MAHDSFREVSTESWFGRLMNSVGGVVIGVLIFLVGFPVLWWNEGRAVRRYETLAEGRKMVTATLSDQIDPAHDNKLVHVMGMAATTETLRDPQFGVTANALKLLRRVEMYQWDETKESKTKKNLGGSETTETTYHYNTEWNENLIDSRDFRIPDGHVNPSSMPYKSAGYQAVNVVLGAFTLAPEIVSAIDKREMLPVAGDVLAKGSVNSDKTAKPWTSYAGGFYRGANPSVPEVGDLKVNFSVVPNMEVSVVARQSGKGLMTHATSKGQPLLLVEPGRHTAEEMFARAEQANQRMTMLLRFVGGLVMFVGLTMVFKPLSVMADVIPFFGSLVGMGTAIAAGLIALPCAAVTIAVAWIAYRPLLAVGIIAVAVAVVVGFIMVRGPKPHPTA